MTTATHFNRTPLGLVEVNYRTLVGLKERILIDHGTPLVNLEPNPANPAVWRELVVVNDPLPCHRKRRLGG